MEIEKGTAQGAGICGIILLICGVASSISGFVWIGIHGFGGYGLWSGVGLVVAGILGVVAWWKRNKGVLVGFLVVTIIMIFVASGQGITSGVLYGVFKVYLDPGRCFTSNGICYCRQNPYTTYKYDELLCDKWKDLMNALLAITIFNVVGAIICLAGSIFGCMGTCCASTQSQPGAVVVQQPVFMTTTTQHGYPAQQPGYAPQQQPGYAPQQQPGYAPQHQPGYAPQQQPGYAPQPEAAYPPPQYTEKH